MKEDIRRRLFIPAISLVIFFFWFPVSTLISFVPQSIRFNDEPIKKEELINGMIRAFNSLCNNKCTLVLMLKSDGVNNDFYLGVRSNSSENSSAPMMKTLKLMI